MGLKASQQGPVVARIGTKTGVNATYTSTYVDMGLHRNLRFLIDIGSDAAADISIQVKEATDSAGTGAQNLGSAEAITAATGDDKTYSIDLSSADLSTGFTHVAVAVAIANTSSGTKFCCLGIATDDSRYLDENDDLASTVEL